MNVTKGQPITYSSENIGWSNERPFLFYCRKTHESNLKEKSSIRISSSIFDMLGKGAHDFFLVT